jgi:hypothetical protein
MHCTRHALSAVALAAVFVLVTGCWTPAQAQVQKGSADNAALRKELESTYRQVRTALKAKNYDAFTALFEPPPGKSLTKAEWPQASEALADLLPDPSKIRFIRLVPDSDWAGYFFQELDNDANYITVTLFRFHRVGQAWKLSGAVQSNSIRKEKSAVENNAEIEKWIDGKKDIAVPKR